LVAGVGSAMGRQPAGAAADVEVEFIGADGTPRREPLSGCWNLAFERVAPLRGLRRSAGSATGRVCSGSPLPVSMWGMSPGWSRDRLMALDADPEVVGVAAQPMCLRWLAESGRSVRHAPDYFVRRADGTGVVIDMSPDQDAAVSAATARLCAQVR